MMFNFFVPKILCIKLGLDGQFVAVLPDTILTFGSRLKNECKKKKKKNEKEEAFHNKRNKKNKKNPTGYNSYKK